MSITRKMLKDLGLESEAIEKIIGSHTDVINNIKDESEALKAEIEKLKSEKSNDVNLDDYVLKAEYEKINNEFTDYKNNIANKETLAKKQTALKSALETYKAKDVALIEKMLDNEKIKYEDVEGAINVSGVSEQIEKIKESHSYLFEEKKQEPNINLGAEHQEILIPDDEAKINAIMGIK